MPIETMTIETNEFSENEAKSINRLIQEAGICPVTKGQGNSEWDILYALLKGVAHLEQVLQVQMNEESEKTQADDAADLQQHRFQKVKVRVGALLVALYPWYEAVESSNFDELVQEEQAIETRCRLARVALFELEQNNTKPFQLSSTFSMLEQKLRFVEEACATAFGDEKISSFTDKLNKKLIKNGVISLKLFSEFYRDKKASRKKTMTTNPALAEVFDPGQEEVFDASEADQSFDQIRNALYQKLDLNERHAPWVKIGLQFMPAIACWLLYGLAAHDVGLARRLELDDEVLKSVESSFYPDLRFMLSDIHYTIPLLLTLGQSLVSSLQLGERALSGNLDFQFWQSWQSVLEIVPAFYHQLVRYMNAISSGVGVTIKDVPLFLRVMGALGESLFYSGQENQKNALADFYLYPSLKDEIEEKSDIFGKPALSIKEMNLFPSSRKLMLGGAISFFLCAGLASSGSSFEMYAAYFLITHPLSKTFSHLYDEIGMWLTQAGKNPARTTLVSTMAFFVLATIYTKPIFSDPAVSDLFGLFISLAPAFSSLYDFSGLNPFMGFMGGIVFSQFMLPLSTLLQGREGMLFAISKELVNNLAFYAMAFMGVSYLSMVYCNNLDVTAECGTSDSKRAFMGQLTVFYSIVFILKTAGALIAATIAQKNQRMAPLLEQLVLLFAALVHSLQSVTFTGLSLRDGVSSGEAMLPSGKGPLTELKLALKTLFVLFAQPGIALSDLFVDFILKVIARPAMLRGCTQLLVESAESVYENASSRAHLGSTFSFFAAKTEDNVVDLNRDSIVEISNSWSSNPNDQGESTFSAI